MAYLDTGILYVMKMLTNRAKWRFMLKHTCTSQRMWIILNTLLDQNKCKFIHWAIIHKEVSMSKDDWQSKMNMKIVSKMELMTKYSITSPRFHFLSILTSIYFTLKVLCVSKEFLVG